MSRELEREIQDVALWYKEHRKELTDLDKKMEFTIKFCDLLLWTLARAVEDIKHLEGRSSLYIPDHVKFSKEFRS